MPQDGRPGVLDLRALPRLLRENEDVNLSLA